MRLGAARMDSPLGRLILVVHDGRLCGLSFPGGWSGLRRHLAARFGEVAFESGEEQSAVVRCVSSYFAGELTALDEIEVDPGGTPFQQKVWRALRRIPHGQTSSYRELAHAVGQPGAARAVATANATNPVAIVIPCHRVIHADGSISGYGGGVERKRWLLRHEAEHRTFALTPYGR